MRTRLETLSAPATAPVAETPDRVVLETVAAILEGQLDMDATLTAVAHAAQRSLGSDRASCFVHDGVDTRIVSVHTTAADPRERAFLEDSVGIPAARLPICRILVEQDDPLLVVEDVRAAERIPPKLADRLGSGAIVGVRLEHRTVTEGGRPALLGTLFLSFREPRRLSPDELSSARTLGGLASLAIANARLHARTLTSLASAEQRAALDPLTGLANHRTFHEALRRGVAAAAASGRPIALVLLDIDHFKQVNDTFGHQAGDRVLAEVGARLREVARDEDMVARIGGEEFGWIMEDTDAAGALAAAERAREALSAPMEGVGMLTASAGVCDLAAARHAGELFELADGALYWAKAHGRDVAIRYAADVVTDLSAEERAERLERVRALAGLRALARAVDAKDHSTRRHSERVAHVAVQLATAVGWPVSRAARLHEAGLLHDVGKIGVPDAVLFKPGSLTPEEFEQVKQHAPLGANIAAEVLDREQVEWIRHHHERWDGTGYPDGLAGAEPGDGAHILALADAWDVMTSARSYKSPLAVPAALEECRTQSGLQFAPWTVEALERLVAAGAFDAAPVASAPAATPAARPVEPGAAAFAAVCGQAVDELRRAMGWEQAFLTRIEDGRLEVIAAGGAGLLRPGTRMRLDEAFCHRMLGGDAPPAHGRLSDEGSGYADLPARAALGVESYSGHPVRLPDGSLFGTLCAVDRAPRPVSARGRDLGDALARLIAWEAGRERVATALGRARAGLAGD
jgi:diguanylate cyclase (GGDEF)-like protein